MAARANGVEEREIIKGVLRNAFIPYLNYIGMTIPSFFGGSIIVESLFSWAGLGQLLVKAVMVKDFPLLMGGIMLTGLIVVISLFVIDVLMYMLESEVTERGVGWMKSRKKLVFWCSLLGVIVVLTLFSDLFATQPVNEMDMDDVYAPPGDGHLLGTDHLGTGCLFAFIGRRKSDVDSRRIFSSIVICYRCHLRRN